MPRKGVLLTQVGDRIKRLRGLLGGLRPDGEPVMSQATFGAKLAETIGGPTVGQGKVSEWENGDPDRYVLAAIAFMYPKDPTACLVYLLGGPEIAGLPRYGRSTAPEIDGARIAADLEAAARKRASRKRKNG